MNECANTDCTEEAMSDAPRLCPRHTMEFFLIFGAVTRDRLEREAAESQERAGDT